jgi:hypothetical protein
MNGKLLGTLAAAVGAAAHSASGMDNTATAAWSDQRPTHAELVAQRTEAALDPELKSMKPSLRQPADQERLFPLACMATRQIAFHPARFATSATIAGRRQPEGCFRRGRET